MSKCKTQNNVDYNTLKAMGSTHTEAVESIHSGSDVISSLRENRVIESLDRANIKKELKATADALDKIPEFKEKGMIIPKKTNKIYGIANSFLTKLATQEEDRVMVLNNTTEEGYLSSVDLGIITNKDGVYYTTSTQQEINDRLRKKVANHIDSSKKKYATVKANGQVNINALFQEDYNNYLYNKYRRTVANESIKAVRASSTPGNIPKETEDHILKELRATPIIDLLNRRKNVLKKKQATMRRQGITDKTMYANITRELNDIAIQKHRIGKNLDREELLDYFSAIIESAQIVRSEQHISPGEILSLKAGLKTIVNSAKADSTNPILDYKDILDPEFFTHITLAGGEAGVLLGLLEDRLEQIMLNDLNDELRGNGEEITLEDMMHVKGLHNSRKRFVQASRGIQHIQNPLPSYIMKLVDKARIRANMVADGINRELQGLFDGAKNNTNAMDAIRQRDKEGTITGFATDVFSSEYWGNLKKFDKKAHRLTSSIDWNPEVLFSKENTPAKVYLEETLKDMLGEYAYNMHYDVAKRKWEMYQNALESFKDTNPSAAVLDRWVKDNSPIERIKAFKGGIKAKVTTKAGVEKDSKYIAGSDAFLHFTPRKVSIHGKVTGYFDANYNIIENDPSAMKFYQAYRDNAIKNELLQDKYWTELRPPEMGYISTSAKELILKEGRVLEGLDKMTRKYRETSTHVKHDKVEDVGIPIKMLKNRVHTVRAEISRRVDVAMREHDKVAQYNMAKRSDQARRRKFRQETIKLEARQLEQEGMGNLMESIGTTNRATAELIEKSKIEMNVNLAINVLNSANMTHVGDKTEGLKAAETMTNHSITQYMNINFYDEEFRTNPVFFNNKKATKKMLAAEGGEAEIEAQKDGPTKAFASQNATKIVMDLTRWTFLGWSPFTAVRNIGQGVMFNSLKALEGKYYSFSSLMRGIGLMTTPKARKMLTALYVLGDLTYGFEESDMYDVSKKISWMNPMRLTTEAEKINQGSVTMAILEDTQVKNSKTGEISSVFHALDDNNNLSDDWVHEDSGTKGLDFMAELVITKIRPANHEASGDFTSTSLAQSHDYGKLALMLRRHIPEMFMDRFGARRREYLNNEEVMGKYLGLVAAVKNRGLTGLDSMEKAKALSAIRELIMMTTLKAFVVLLGKLLCQSDECKEQHGFILFSLNMLGDIANDAMTITPASIWSIAEDPFVIISEVNNLIVIADQMAELIVPGGETGRYQKKTDFNEKGDVKFLRNMLKSTPLLRQLLRFQEITNRLGPNAVTNEGVQGKSSSSKMTVDVGVSIDIDL